MIEKVNPSHPDKLADRIAGAIVDLCYAKSENPKVAVEVLIGHGHCYIVMETSEDIFQKEIFSIVQRIAGGKYLIDVIKARQDRHLEDNQVGKMRCGDNGIFRGVPLTKEEKMMSLIARMIYSKYPTDGKYILDGNECIICQSNADADDPFWDNLFMFDTTINPLGYWTGGTDVDSGAVNRKLGSDMGNSVTGGGLHGKDLSKADVSVNIYAFLKAQATGEVVEISCAIGDEYVDGRPYEEIVDIARRFIDNCGGFEKFAEWGLF